jgi:raffinose/stachyose/melibiose transport system permease protein
MVAPALLLYAFIVVYPALRGLSLSFTDTHGIVGGHYVGLANYRRMLSDPAMRAALVNTLAFVAVVVVVQNGLALVLAYWLNKLPAVRNIARAGLLVPAMLAIISVGYVWSAIYSPLGGQLNTILGWLGLDSLEHVWLGNPRTALVAIAAANIWMYLGYSTTIFLANYLAIPRDLLEAAALDGASGFSRFRHLDWPLLAPSLTVNITLSVIGSLRVFEMPFVMTRGGPDNATKTLALIIYNASFDLFEYGYGTAVAVVLMILTIAMSVLITVGLRRREAVL